MVPHGINGIANTLTHPTSAMSAYYDQQTANTRSPVWPNSSNIPRLTTGVHATSASSDIPSPGDTSFLDAAASSIDTGIHFEIPFLIITCVCGLVGNFLVLAVYSRTKYRRRSNAAHYILNLAVGKSTHFITSKMDFETFSNPNSALAKPLCRAIGAQHLVIGAEGIRGKEEKRVSFLKVVEKIERCNW